MQDLIKLLFAYRSAETPEKSEKFAQELASLIWRDLVFFVPRRCYPLQSEADDIIQETLIKVFRMEGSFEGTTTEKFRAWYKTIALNKVIDLKRNRGEEPVESFDDESIEHLENIVHTFAEDDPISEKEREDLDTVLRWLRVSKPECRTILLRKYLDNENNASLAESFGISSKAASARFRRCLELAREKAKTYAAQK